MGNIIKLLTAQALTSASTTLTDVLGELAMDSNGTIYRYSQAGAAVAQYDACKQGTGSYVVIPTAAVNEVVLGSAQIAVASGSYFWMAIKGKATNKVVVATAAGSPLVTTATAGTLGLADATAFGGIAGVAVVTGVAAGSEIYLK